MSVQEYTTTGCLSIRSGNIESNAEVIKTSEYARVFVYG
jgi:hypothetical protein